MKLLLCAVAVVAFAGTAMAGAVDDYMKQEEAQFEADTQRLDEESKINQQIETQREDTQRQIDQANDQIRELNKQIQELRDDENY